MNKDSVMYGKTIWSDTINLPNAINLPNTPNLLNTTSPSDNTADYPIEIICDDSMYYVHNSITDLSAKNIKVIILRSAVISLQRLNVRDNRISFFPPIYSLVYLDCSNCRLSKIPTMPNLETLICKNNMIRTITNMGNLVKLDCSRNPMVRLHNLPKISHITYDKCLITTIFENDANISNIMTKKHRSSSIINGSFRWVEHTPILINWTTKTIKIRPSTVFSAKVYKFLFHQLSH